jgi:phosphatidate cytidylyltransferase
MAFNWQTFRTRTFSAAVFVVVMLTGLFWNPWSFLILFTIIHFGCWWEYFNLLEKIHQTRFQRYTGMGLMMIGFGLMLWFCGPVFQVNGYGLKQNLSLPVSVAGVILLTFGIFRTRKIKARALAFAALGLVYISLSWGLMIQLYNATNISIRDNMFVWNGNFIPVMIIISIWVNDTMAYIVGSIIGKTPFSKISPKKTWEGTIGGIILAILVVGLLVPLIYFGSPIFTLTIFLSGLSAIASVAGTSGDLLESKIKRMAGVKDSGHMMPGHGGFLDRFDSLLIAIPFVWIYVMILVNAFDHAGFVS